MAKSSLRRYNTLRLCDKWRRIIRDKYPEMDMGKVTFGRIQSQDPLDCGNPQCKVCSGDKVLRPKQKRITRKREDRLEFLNEIGAYEQQSQKHIAHPDDQRPESYFD